MDAPEIADLNGRWRDCSPCERIRCHVPHLNTMTDRGDIPNHQQALEIIQGQLNEINSLRNMVKLYQSKWYECRKHLRVANRSLEVHAKLTQLQTFQNLSLQAQLKQERNSRAER